MISSVFWLGAHSGQQVCQSIIEGKTEVGTPEGFKRKLSVMELHSIAKIPRDTTDRNRTSPFAFTGNKFEFRAVGSSQTCATPVTTINTIITESIIYLADEIEKRLKEAGLSGKGAQVSAAEEDDRVDIIHGVVSDTLREHYAIVFNGNNYSEEWEKEAEIRGLPNLRTAPEALAVYDAQKNIDLFSKLGVLSEREQRARSNLTHELFLKHLIIEAQTMTRLAENYVLPASLQYQKNVCDSITAAAQVLGNDGGDALAAQKKQLKKLVELIADLMRKVDALKDILEKEKKETEEEPQALLKIYHPAISAGMRALRVVCDSLEDIVDDSVWPLPKYSEMLFLV